MVGRSGDETVGKVRWWVGCIRYLFCFQHLIAIYVFRTQNSKISSCSKKNSRCVSMNFLCSLQKGKELLSMSFFFMSEGDSMLRDLID